MTLTPVVVGTLTADPFDDGFNEVAGNQLPYQVGVEFLGPITAGNPGVYHPVLTPVDDGTLTGTPF